jgi:hypothetical protein
MRGEIGPPTGCSLISRPMPPVFWIGLGIAAFIFLTGAFAGARSRTASLGSGAAIGAFLGVMCAFPLLAIGLATT